MTPVLQDSPDRIASVASILGCAAFFALLLVVPLAVPPPSVFLIFTITSEVVFAKMFVTRLLCVVIVAATAVRILRNIPGDWRFGAAALPFLCLLAFLLTLLLACFFSPARAFSFSQSYSEIGLTLATLCGTFCLTTVRRVRALLYATCIAGVVVALIGLLTRFVTGEIMEFLYGRNPFGDLLEAGSDISRVEGGLTRGPFMATLANTEFAGNYMALAFLLAGSWLMDGWGTRHHRNPVFWLIGTGCFAVLGAAVVLSATRGALIVIIAGLIARWLATLKLRGLYIAAALCTLTLLATLIGVRVTALCGIAALLGVLIWQLATGQFLTLWKPIVPGTKALLLCGASAGALLILAVLLPGPWQSGSLYVVERLSEAASPVSRSVRERLTFYMIASGMVADNPLLGIGPGRFASEYHTYLALLNQQDPSGVMERIHYRLETLYARQTHNDYFQIAAERGVPSLACFLALVATVLAALARIVRSRLHQAEAVAHALLTLICGFMTNMLTSFPLFEGARLATFYGMLAGALALIRIASLKSDPVLAPTTTTPDGA